MLPQKIAIDLVPVVNDIDDYGALQEYAAHRISYLHHLIENSDDINEIQRSKGAIRELRRFANLREEVIADSRP